MSGNPRTKFETRYQGQGIWEWLTKPQLSYAGVAVWFILSIILGQFIEGWLFS